MLQAFLCQSAAAVYVCECVCLYCRHRHCAAKGDNAQYAVLAKEVQIQLFANS